MKKDLLDVSELLSFEKSRVKNWLDKLRFSHILLVWVGLVTCYGLIYFYFSSPANYVFDTLHRVPVTDLWQTIYFSFVTATTTGFGDVIPMGNFRIIAIAEVITGLLLLAIVTSKFVSIKQDQIMKELYDISLSEKINRLRSSLFLYKQHLNRLTSNAQEGTFKDLDQKNLGMYFTSYEDVLVETLTLLNKEDNDEHQIVDLDLDFLARSIVNALEKTIEAGKEFSENKIPWTKGNKNILLIIADVNEELFKKLETSPSINKQTKEIVLESHKMISSLQELAS
ncbi:MAG: two pore domain potassium channel family protein [Nanoarchaeota archaeon]|nr:two pore domain potassium channel family protein [Nanoarchaeota archaeon]